jgi:hypothetical protein
LLKWLALTTTGAGEKTMPWDAISDQLVWIGAAAVLVVLVAAIAIYSVNKPKPYYGTSVTMQFRTNRTDGYQLEELIFLILNQLITLSSR